MARQHTGVYSLDYRSTCRLEARQVLIYQCISDLTGENDKYNYSKAVHLSPAFSDIFLSAKNYKIASALTDIEPGNPRFITPRQKRFERPRVTLDGVSRKARVPHAGDHALQIGLVQRVNGDCGGKMLADSGKVLSVGDRWQHGNIRSLRAS